MAILSYYVAQSLDGFIADPQSGVDWLESFQPGSLAWTKTQGDHRRESLFGYQESLEQETLWLETVRKGEREGRGIY
jgi:hypothetical protein